MDKMIEHMTDNHDEVKTEEYVETCILAVESCYICNKMFYSEGDLDKPNVMNWKFIALLGNFAQQQKTI